MPLDGIFISKQDLEMMIEYYHKDATSQNLALKGFMFRKGTKGDKEALFPDPLFSRTPFGIPSEKNDRQLPNENVPGCPFPPGYGEGDGNGGGAAGA